MEQNAWAVPCIEAHLRDLTLSTKCIKKSALSLLSMSEHADLISKIWLQTFKTASEPASQLALLYVLNEVLQNCINYGAPEMKNNLKEPILSAIKALRPGLVIEKVKKLLIMWAQQGVFDQDFNKRLLKLVRYLDSLGKRPEPNINKYGAESFKDFSPEKLIRQLQDYGEIEVNAQISELELVFSLSSNPVETTLSRIKSKEEGVSFSKQVSACVCQLDSALNDLSRKLAAQEALVKNIDKAMLFYSAQEKDARGVANAYKLYEQQIRETLRSVDRSCGYSITERIQSVDDVNDEGDTEYSCRDLLTAQTYTEDGVSDMSDVEEVDDIACSRTGTATVPVSDLLVDPRSLSDLPFNEYIAIDDQGDVDYRPMFSKILENNTDNSKIKSEGSVTEVDPKEPPLVRSATVLTESGDFDYRKPAVKNEDRENPAKIDPFGLGTQQDADLRLLKPPLSEQPLQSSPPAATTDSDYRQLPPLHLLSNPAPIPQVLSPPSASSWLNSADSDLRQSPSAENVVGVNPVATRSSPFKTALPPPPISSHPHSIPQLSATVPSAIHIAAPPRISSHQTYQLQQLQQAPVSTSKFPDIPATLLSTLRKISQSSASVLPSQPSTQSQPLVDGGQVVLGAVKSDEAANLQQEDPFSIISRLTGLSNLMQSVKAAPTRTTIDGGSPAISRAKASADSLPTLVYSEGPNDKELDITEKPASHASNSPSNAAQQISAPEAEDGEQSDGGATPTQDESENPGDAPISVGHFPFSQAELGQISFPPPPMQTTSGASSNLLLNLPPMGLPHTFNPLGIGQTQQHWQTNFPPGLTNMCGRTFPTQAFFPVFPPMFSRPPAFPNFSNSQNNQ